MKSFINSLGSYLKRMSRILSNPIQGMENEPLQFPDGLTTVLILFAATILQKILWNVLLGEAIAPWNAAASVFLACAIGWGGLSSLFYGIGRLRKSKADYSQITAYTGVAALPLILTTCLSILVIGAEFLFVQHPQAEIWMKVHNVIGWTGMALGWPGYFSGLALHSSVGMKKTSALIIALVLLILFMLGWWMPAATIPG